MWCRIKPVFGDCDPRSVRLEDISAWRKMIEEAVSLREAHRCIKIWRAMWKVSAALGYCVRDADPSLGVRNRAAPGRSASMDRGRGGAPVQAGLARRLSRTGGRHCGGLVDAVEPRRRARTEGGHNCQRRRRGDFFTDRAKTGKPVGGVFNDRALAALKRTSARSASNSTTTLISSVIEAGPLL